jgi:hypothetical protein
MADYQTIEARMLARARQDVLAHAEWLTVAEIAGRARIPLAEAASMTSQWQRECLIFAIDQCGEMLLPGYGLDPDAGYHPLHVLRDVLATFAGSKDAWHLAYWFVSLNGWLGGKRPQDLLGVAPDRVIIAAQREVEGVIHG